MGSAGGHEHEEVFGKMSNNNSSSDEDHEDSLIGLFTAGHDVAPPASVWAAIADQLDGLQGKIDRKNDGIWAETAPHVRTKLLWDGRSLLIECGAGAVIPEHEHWADERIIVISGDMIVDNRSYFVGDTLWMANGSQHGETTTRSGCLLLISYVS